MMNLLKRDVVNFAQEVKIERFVGNTVNVKNRLAKNIQRNLLRVMIVLDLVKIECFKDNLEILGVIDGYMDSIAYSKSFCCIDICFV